MRIFLSYSKFDKGNIDFLINGLVEQGHEVVYEDLNIKVNDNWFQKINEGLKGYDAIVLIISKYTLKSRYGLKEIESIILNDISRKKTRIIPITLDGTFPPGYLSNYQILDLSQDIQFGFQRLTEILATDSEIGEEKEIKEERVRKDNQKRNEAFIKSLSNSLKDGRLTLVCGAGVSIGANIPSWNELLLRLLESMMKKISNSNPFSLKNISTREFQRKIGSSSLVMSKYLKSNLGKDFLNELRDALYQDNPTTCELIEAIVELSRPQRDGNPIDSIITFNFDALIEENLGANNIKYKAIDNEGVRNQANELPIYHVHGYLPRKGRISSNRDVVFSEDAYHTQFIEPFSWSNLIQLNKLSQNTCLFVGMSLTDPNLRRLLDVANRKESSKFLNHYVIKKTPEIANSNGQIDDLMIFLEEQDANELGLNVIWVEKFDEIPNILKQMIH
ncbi:MAG: SIR2 family protein [Marinifilaceae bacterium]